MLNELVGVPLMPSESNPSKDYESLDDEDGSLASESLETETRTSGGH